MKRLILAAGILVLLLIGFVYVADQLFHFIEEDQPIDAVINIKRFD